MGAIYALLSLLTVLKRKHAKDVFLLRIRFWGKERHIRKTEGKKEPPLVVEAIIEALQNVQKSKSTINASEEADDKVDDWLSNNFNNVENIHGAPNYTKQVPFSDDKCRSDEEIDNTSLDVNTFVGYIGPVQVVSTFDLHQSLIRQVQLFKYCQMSHLKDGFFTFKFPTEDQEIEVLEHGQLFIENKPLVLKRWSPSTDLVPTNFLSSIPIWVRFYNLNWVYWNQVCLSKISSIIGIPLFMDRGTATMTRLEYARVCIEVNTTMLRLPDTVHMLRNGKIIPVPVEYEWKPLQCVICLSVYHDSSSCTSVGVGELSAEFLQQANATKGALFRSSYDEDGVDTISVSSGPQCAESSIEGNLDDALHERMSFLGQNP